MGTPWLIWLIKPCYWKVKKAPCTFVSSAGKQPDWFYEEKLKKFESRKKPRFLREGNGRCP